ncbi:hypothetical protein ACR8G9_22565 [Salmonella enterica subsp. enterica serovar Paratyphi A]
MGDENQQPAVKKERKRWKHHHHRHHHFQWLEHASKVEEPSKSEQQNGRMQLRLHWYQHIHHIQPPKDFFLLLP